MDARARICVDGLSVDAFPVCSAFVVGEGVEEGFSEGGVGGGGAGGERRGGVGMMAAVFGVMVSAVVVVAVAVMFAKGGFVDRGAVGGFKAKGCGWRRWWRGCGSHG